MLKIKSYSGLRSQIDALIILLVLTGWREQATPSVPTIKLIASVDVSRY
jgi:hypothetical protein